MRNLLRFFILMILTAPATLFSQQPENPGFENWEDIGNGIIEPVEWNTIKSADNPSIAELAPITYEKSTDAHSGTYSLKLYNVYVLPGLVATGAICNGMFHAEYDLAASYSYTKADDPKYNTVFPYRPDSLVGWFKFYPNETDRAQFKVILHVSECKLPANGTFPNWVAMAVFITDPGVTYDSWTRFAVPFNYFNDKVPEHELTVMNSGDSTMAIDGSQLFIDDLQFVYGPSGIADYKQNPSFFYIDNRNLIIKSDKESDYLGQWLYIIDISGRTVFSKQLESNRITIPASIKEGVFVAVLKSKSDQYVQKFSIQK